VKLSDTNLVKMGHNTLKATVGINQQCLEKNSGVDDFEFVNNIAYNTGLGLAAEFNYIDEVAVCNNNLFYAPNSNNHLQWGNDFVNSMSDLGEGDLNENSHFENPLFDPNMETLQAASPARNAGVELSYASISLNGETRNATPDLGAWQHQIIQYLDTPQNVAITYNSTDNVMLITWDPVPNATAYRLEAAYDSPDGDFLFHGIYDETEILLAPMAEINFFRVVALRDYERKLESNTSSMK
jgi:hypothetical protein